MPDATIDEEEIPDVLKYIPLASGTLMALGGIFAAWWIYVRQPGLSVRLAARVPALYQLSLNKFYFDELYSFFIVQPIIGLAEFCRAIDLYVVDGLVDIVGEIPRLFGALFRPIQNGLTQFYALAMALGVAVFLVAMVWRIAVAP